MASAFDGSVLRVPLRIGVASGAAVRALVADPIQVRVRGLRKSYGDHVVLEDVSFDIQRGAMNAIVGASGCGKTVLLRQLLHLEKPDAGSIELDGVNLVPLDDVAMMKERYKMGVVFQDSALLDSLSVYENVALPLREHEPGLDKRQLKERVRAGLEALGVAAAIDKLPAELSGGMKKRVAVARALITKPALLIYDEPTRGLDPVSARMVDRMIASTDAALHVTSLMISHDLKSVYDIADYVSLLRNGKVELSAPHDAFFVSKNPHVRAFLDASHVDFARPRPEPAGDAPRQ